MPGVCKIMRNRLKPPLLLVLAGLLGLFAWHLSKLPDGHKFSVTATPERSRTAGPDPVYYGPAHSVAVLAFQPLRPAQAEPWLQRAVALELSGLLTSVSGLQVTAPTSALFFDSAGDGLQGIGQRLQVARLVRGEIALGQGTLEAHIRVVESRTGQAIWEGSFATAIEQVSGTVAEMAQQVLQAIKPGSVVPAARYVGGEAWQAYYQGRYQLDQGNPQRAEALFLAALQSDPEYGPARLGLAQALLAGDPARVADAERAIESALETDSNLARAYGWRSLISRDVHWNWPAALDAGERALQLSPGDAWLMNRAAQAKISMGQFAAASGLLRQSVVRDPVNLGTRVTLGLSQEFGGDYEAALKTYRVLLGLNPDFPGAHALRARIKILQDNAASALRESEREPDRFWALYARALALAASGQRAEAESARAELLALSGDAAAYQMAEISALLGEVEAAFQWLQTALEQRDGGLRELLGNPFLHGLRSDVRWAQMVTGLGLPLDAEEVNH